MGPGTGPQRFHLPAVDKAAASRMTLDNPALPPELKAAAQFAATYLAEAVHRSSSAEIERLLVHRYGLRRRQAHAIIRHLVASGELVYTYEHGSSFLEPSFCRPVRVGKRVVLVPDGHPYRAAAGQVTVRIAPGASFGSGRHPSTRLAIRGIEQALEGIPWNGRPQRPVVLDIGTGSGVLVIAAVMLGAGQGVGIDLDPCARHEARQNVRLNRRDALITISDQTVEKIEPTGRFDLIAANLRLPTLLNRSSSICNLMNSSARLVLSGIRVEEMDGLSSAYRANGFRLVWVAQEKGWSAGLWQRQGD